MQRLTLSSESFDQILLQPDHEIIMFLYKFYDALENSWSTELYYQYHTFLHYFCTDFLIKLFSKISHRDEDEKFVDIVQATFQFLKFFLRYPDLGADQPIRKIIEHYEGKNCPDKFLPIWLKYLYYLSVRRPESSIYVKKAKVWNGPFLKIVAQFLCFNHYFEDIFDLMQSNDNVIIFQNHEDIIYKLSKFLSKKSRLYLVNIIHQNINSCSQQIFLKVFSHIAEKTKYEQSTYEIYFDKLVYMCMNGFQEYSLPEIERISSIQAIFRKRSFSSF